MAQVLYRLDKASLERLTGIPWFHSFYQPGGASLYAYLGDEKIIWTASGVVVIERAR